jgi:hypothetical protein
MVRAHSPKIARARVATPGALAALAKAGQTPLDFPWKHVRGDWGELDKEDRKEDELSLKRGFCLLGRYRTNGGARPGCQRFAL